MKYTVLSLFPEIIHAFFTCSVLGKAVRRGIVGYEALNIRDFALDRHRTCDDAPYGGGAGMLMTPGPLGRALEAAGVPPKEAARAGGKTGRVVYLSPSGRLFTQEAARELAREPALVLICGRYEGIDQRVIDRYADDEISVGDYVLSSGEAAALVVVDATYRLAEAAISPASLEEESFSNGLLEYPQYTRPAMYGSMNVPEVLLSGHHKNIRQWRLEKRVERTCARRPDLIRRGMETGLFDKETRAAIEKAEGAGKSAEAEIRAGMAEKGEGGREERPHSGREDGIEDGSYRRVIIEESIE
ncbi:MAG: tRNA (guanosine(37)-N1)-methyltransferase TrmD [Spirochaetaceae bacterium]|jgi:tRNA (guanine37-N1)-methyltransferase|nr:tRNA (guanosine(37)-N1)-methyltransferase TrmD [Spirochaetaceae bacterium]